MRPVERAAAVYQQEECARTFAEDLEAHLMHGFVYSDENLFYMARPVSYNATGYEITNPWHNTWGNPPDMWHVYLYSGALRDLFVYAPNKFQYASFERNNILRRYQWDVIWRKCVRFSTSSLMS